MYLACLNVLRYVFVADFYAASAYHQCGVPTSFFTPVFVVGRTAGWMAHVLVGRRCRLNTSG